MAPDLYAACPCGSGKKFKWCCQPIHGHIDKAFRLDADGQHEVALRILDEVTAAHPSNPEAWGRKAHLLFQNGRLEEAETALQKAFDLNPQYPFGHWLRGMFRQQEGELAGALLLFRKAAELYDPDAKEILAQIYSLIADSELRLNRPVAARAALEICLRLQADPGLSQELEETFGVQSRLPASARRAYTLASPPGDAAPEWRNTWNRALSAAATGKLSDAARAFEQLAAKKPDEAAAHYNLGLVRAWLGENRAALDALEHYVRLEPDADRAASAWALAEVLRFGQGMEDQADYVEHAAWFQIKDLQHLFHLLQEWQREYRLAAVQVRQEEGIVSGVVLDSGGLLTAAAAPKPYPKLGAYLMVVQDVLRLWNTNAERLERTRQELQQRAGPSLSEARLVRGPAHFGDIYAEAVIFPSRVSEEEARSILREHVQRYFEESWLHRPLRALGNVPPIDAAGHPVLRKRLLGVVQFLQECALAAPPPYDFDRLRRKLGLLSAAPAGTQPGAAAPVDIDALSTAELAGLQLDTLSDEQVEQACRAAQKLDARELASRFAQTLVSRPPRPERPDRFPWYAYLVQTALAAGDTQTALRYVDEGEKEDGEQNEGRRRNDYELRRGQILAKGGDAEGARDVFERLIARAPSEVRYCGTAAESMLSVKRAATALHFAEQGLARARQSNDRECEQYFLELVGAAKKQAAG